jgi:uncharacterized protein
MESRPYYIYCLKDPRVNPSKIFYVGKGTGIRAWSHGADQTRKGKKIADIKASGFEIIVEKLVEDLGEIQACKLEAELIATFGTEDYGGLLANSVEPTGITKKPRKLISEPIGVLEKAQLGLNLLKDAIVNLIQANNGKLQNADIAKALGLQSDFMGGQKDYLSWSIIGVLMREGRVKREQGSRFYSV